MADREPTTLMNTEDQLRGEIEELKYKLRQQKDQNDHKNETAHGEEKPEHPRSRTLIVGAIVVIILIVVGFFVGWLPRHRRQATLEAEEKKEVSTLPEVTVVPVQRAPFNGELVLPGNVQAVTEAPVLARADGYIKRRYVDIGDRVKAGQLLAEIEAPELLQQVQQAQASLESAKADQERTVASFEQGRANEQLAKVTAGRWDNLARKGVVSRQENDNYQAQYQAQTANVKALDRSIQAAKSNVNAAQANVNRLTEVQSYVNVRAPFAGVITVRNIDVGALVTPGSTLLFRIAQTNLLRTYLNVPQTDASNIKAGQSASLTLNDLPGRKFPATVTRTANSLDPSTRTLLAEVQVPNGDGLLLPGMYGQVDLNLPRSNPPFLIPGDALLILPNGTQVAIVDASGTVRMQHVVVGHDDGNQIEIVGGLELGQRVIVSPGDEVREGVKVKPLQGDLKKIEAGPTDATKAGGANQGNNKGKSGSKKNR